MVLLVSRHRIGGMNEVELVWVYLFIPEFDRSGRLLLLLVVLLVFLFLSAASATVRLLIGAADLLAGPFGHGGGAHGQQGGGGDQSAEKFATRHGSLLAYCRQV